ncbi:MAG: F0F1 ATP synthase subunit delta [Nevskia sp.]|nr:F0F1 ATP synthase subunit delta [Nevskia sp.]
MELSTLARPYARAVFELAQESRALPAWSQMLQALAAAVAEPGIAALLADPRLSRSDVGEALAASLGGQLDAQARNLVRLVATNNRVPLLPEIAREFEALRMAAERRVEVGITTAAPLDEALRQKLVQGVRQRLAREVDVTWNTDPALVGGAVIRAGDLVIDGSVAGELAHLRQALLNPSS